MSNDQEAFFAICPDAKPAHRHFVSLYVNLPYYGGPEEGGWWGSDTELVAYHEVSSDDEATEVMQRVKTRVAQLDRDAKDRFTRQCAAECEWLEARGLDSDYLPEVDGEENYWVATESTPGEHVHRGSRYYE
jgi:hypothetical protein